MSVVTQVSGSDPNYFWILAALPVGLAIDLALGNVPGRTLAIRGMKRLIAVFEEAVHRAVARLGGGRGGALFEGSLLTVLVGGSVASLAWLAVDLGDRVGEFGALGVRAVLIAAGLAIRSTGDLILLAAESPDQFTASRWLAMLGGKPPARVNQLGVDRVCLAAAGEVTASLIVAPLFWLALGGPAGLWGFVAIRSLRETMLARPTEEDLASWAATTLADLGELIPALLTWLLIGAAAGIVRTHPLRSWRIGWRAGRSQPRLVTIWGQAALAGALDVQIPAGRVFGANQRDLLWVGESTQPVDGLAVVRAIRIMQVAALFAAGLVFLVSIVW